MSDLVTVKVSRRKAATFLQRMRATAALLRGTWTGTYTLKDPELNKLFGIGSRSDAGPIVNEITAFMCSAFWDGVQQISADVAKMPLDLKIRREGRRIDDYIESKTFRLMKFSPNPETRSMVFRRTVTTHALVYGNGYAEIVRDQVGRPAALWILHPNRVKPFIDNSRRVDGRFPLKYRVDGEILLDPRDILHLQGLTDDGVLGMNLVNLAREAIGLALASQQFAAAFFGNGSAFGGILTAKDRDLDPTDPETEDIRKKIEELNGRADKAFRLLVLGGGWEYQANGGVKPSEAQMKELREQQVVEIARYLNMPPHKLKELSRSTNNNIEHQDLEYYKGTLLNWAILWEQELAAKLVPSLEVGMQFFKHNANVFLRGDIKSRYEALGIARDKGVINADEWRELEDMNPQEGGQGQLYLVQAAQVPLNMIGGLTEAEVDAKKAKAEKDRRPPPAPAPASDSSSSDERARIAEELAAAARAEAEAERERRIAAEQAGEATAEELARLRESEARQQAIATQLTALSAELEARARAEQAAREAVAAELATLTAAHADRELELQRATGQLREATDARAAAIHARTAAEEAARIAEGLAAEAQARAEAATAAAETATTGREDLERQATERQREADAALSQARAAATDLERLTAEASTARERELEALQATESVRAEVTALQAQVRELTDAQTSALALRVEFEQRVADAEAARIQTAAELEQARQELAVRDTRITTAEGTVRDYERQLAALEARVGTVPELEGEAQALRTALTETTAQLAELRSTQQALEQQEADARAAHVAATELLAQLHTTLETQRRERAGVDEELQTARTALSHAEEALVVAAARQQEVEEQLAALASTAGADAERLQTLAQELAASSQAREAAEARIPALEESLRQATDAAHARAAELEASLADARQQLEARRAAERARMTTVIAAHRGLIVDALGRMTRRECEQARHKQSTPEKLRRWLNGFSTLHEAICVEALLPAMRTHLAWRGSAEDPTTVTSTLVREHIAEFTRRLHLVLDSDADDFHPLLDRTLAQWETERAASVADALLVQEIQHVQEL